MRVWEPPCYLRLHNLEHIRPDFARHNFFVLSLWFCSVHFFTFDRPKCWLHCRWVKYEKYIKNISPLLKKSSKIGYLSNFAIRFQKFHFWSNMVIFLTWRFHFYLKYKEKHAALDLLCKEEHMVAKIVFPTYFQHPAPASHMWLKRSFLDKGKMAKISPKITNIEI